MKIERCPHCGKGTGFYQKNYVYGPVSYNLKFDGTEDDNSEMYNALNYKYGKVAYCSECDKKIANVVDMEVMR